MRVLLATTRPLPEPDPDEAVLLAALGERGVDADVASWRDDGVDWGAADAVVVRSTWDYAPRRAAFLRWAAKVTAASTLWNPWPILRWNTHKAYLLDLARHGVPVVPTALLLRGSDESLSQVRAARGWGEVVVKPAVSAGSWRTVRVGPDDPGAGEAHLRALLVDGDALIQPYLPSVEGYGERAVVWIDGRFSHAVRKAPRFHGDEEVVSEAKPISLEERIVAERALAAIPGGADLLYARVDLAPASDGTPCLLELELVEPSLFLPQAPAAAERLADGILARLDGAG